MNSTRIGAPRDLLSVRIGDRIRRRRVELGITQEQLAAALAISYQQIQKYESGANRVSAKRLVEIARELHVTIGHFVDEVGGSSGQSDLQQATERRTVGIARDIGMIEDPEVRLAFAALARAVVDRTSDLERRAPAAPN